MSQPVTDPTSTKPVRVVLLGTHGQRNIGDELLLETFLDHLGDQNSYVVNTYDIGYTRAQLAGRYDVELIHTINDRRALIRALHRSDRLVFAGGSIVKELNRRTTGRSPYATMLMLLAIVTYAKWVARLPQAMLNIGVGPLHTPRGRYLARAILSQVDVVTVRDARSFDLAKSVIGASATAKSPRLSLVTDAVWADDPSWFDRPVSVASSRLNSPEYDPPQVGPALAEQTPNASAIRIALNLNSDLADAEALERFTRTMQQVFIDVAAERAVEIHLLPMQDGFKDGDDVEMLADFATGLGGITVISHRPQDARAVGRILRQCDVLVSERLHAIVIATILGVPSLPLAYDVKVLALADQLGLQDRVIDITKPFDAAVAVDLLNRTIDERHTLSAALTLRASQFREQATQNFAVARRWLQAQS